MLITYLDYFGTAIFAASGVLVAGQRRMDPFGALVLATCTAIGGGTIRDMALGDTPVFWVHQVAYLWIILLASFATIVALWRFNQTRWWLLPVADAIGMATFMAIGAIKAQHLDVPLSVCILMGILTACGGGMLRDVLANRVPLVLRQEIYATACLAGGLVWVLAVNVAAPVWVSTLACVLTALLIRLVAIRHHLSLPKLMYRR
ncbi:trimeric intracellular cation channel family protein [Celerinatantimonas yamalensis]|uniref:Trimeric intracellular cation channel family protein n=1 Tax=Celerinatantimonas yamalensis TaxID=559956 RepID=A0ABW9G9A0_9GAMM